MWLFQVLQNQSNTSTTTKDRTELTLKERLGHWKGLTCLMSHCNKALLSSVNTLQPLWVMVITSLPVKEIKVHTCERGPTPARLYYRRKQKPSSNTTTLITLRQRYWVDIKWRHASWQPRGLISGEAGFKWLFVSCRANATREKSGLNNNMEEGNKVGDVEQK